MAELPSGGLTQRHGKSPTNGDSSVAKSSNGPFSRFSLATFGYLERYPTYDYRSTMVILWLLQIMFTQWLSGMQFQDHSSIYIYMHIHVYIYIYISCKEKIDGWYISDWGVPKVPRPGQSPGSLQLLSWGVSALGWITKPAPSDAENKKYKEQSP